MGTAKKASVGKTSAAAKPRPSKPVLLRVRRDHGGGLWTLEDQVGQLYLSVRTPGFHPVERDPSWATEDDMRLMRELGIDPWH